MSATSRRQDGLDALDDLVDGEDPPSKRPTSPPGAAYAMLRDSCQAPASGDERDIDDLTPCDGVPIFEGEIPEPDGEPVPYVVLSQAELDFVALDAESEALVQAADGMTRVGALAAACGMTHDRATEVVRRLVDRGVMRLR